MLDRGSRPIADSAGRSGISRIAAEFKALNDRRRIEGLSRRDADRYYALFAQLSEALAGVERRRRMDARQFLRVAGEAVLVLSTGDGERSAVCHDFGGGGCAIDYDAPLDAGERVQVQALIVGGRRVSLPARAEVIWRRGAEGGLHALGLRFFIESPDVRDAVDRALYRVLDAYLNGDGPRPPGTARAS